MGKRFRGWGNFDKPSGEVKPRATTTAAAVPKTKTNALTKQALRVLDLKGYEVWRQNNAAVYDTKIEKFRANSSTPGIVDIIGYQRKTGIFVACEIKAGKDRLSQDQINFLNRVSINGGLAMVVRTTDHLEQFIKNQKEGDFLWKVT